ncbi:MAG: tetratricopeptide repeat protein [Gemmatimonadetes bacterium]|nr:tetratricopeptide repeat protein [Gemmatimonadota bacterium]
MNRARWDRVQALFHEALPLPDGERRAFLEDAAEGDEALVGDVLGMLAQDARGDSILDRGVGPAAEAVIGRLDEAMLGRQLFGPYRLLRILGEGGMGVVYLADRADLGSQAAIKILPDAWLSPGRRERFLAEQRTLAQLNDPGIARLYDADTLPDGTPWFAMEFVDGEPLTAWCRSHQCGIRERLALFRTVCEAVRHAHQHAVIHRDLKPSNIMVRADGVVKLLDFGIAKQLEAVDLPADQTRTGLRALTPAYAAPEQLRGGRVGVHSDVYSLGVVLYELLAGRLPHDLSGRSPDEAAAIIAAQEPPRPSVAARETAARAGDLWSALGAGAWADLDVLCLTAMRADPARRYRTVDALLAEVDRFLDGRPLEARPDTVGYRLGKFVRRHAAAVGSGVTIALLVIGLVAFYTLRLARARNAALAEAARTDQIQRFMLNLFQGGEEDVAPADSLRVVTLLEGGVQQAGTLDREPEVQEELYLTLGSVFQRLGKLDRADSLIAKARAQRAARLGPEDPALARVDVALGRLRLDQARFEDAEALVRRGLASARASLPADHPTVVDATVTLGQVLQKRGRYDEAIGILGEVVRRDSTAGDAAPDRAAHLRELANAHFYAGHYPAADSLGRRVLALHEQRYGRRHPEVATDLASLGEIEVMLGRYAAAESSYAQALAITEGWYGEDHPEVAANLTRLGRALTYERKLPEANAALERAFAIQERVFGPVHPQVAEALNELGNAAWTAGELDLAEARFRRVVAIYRQVFGTQHQFVAVAMSNLASVLSEKKDYHTAEDLFRQAIAIYDAVLSPGHVNAGIGHIKLGRTLLRQRRFREATVETRAGYDILVRQTDPATSFLRAARKDLAAAFDSLGEPAQAARFHAELADTIPPATAVARPAT